MARVSQVFNEPGQFLADFAVHYSQDGRVAVASDTAVTVYSITSEPRSAKPTIATAASKILPNSKQNLCFDRPLQLAEFSRDDAEDAPDIYCDQVVVSLTAEHETLVGFRRALWSPRGLGPSGSCLLATLSCDRRLLVHRLCAHSAQPLTATSVGQLWQQHKQRRLPTDPHPLPHVLSTCARVRQMAYSLALIEMVWTDVRRDGEVGPYCHLLAVSRSGEVSCWGFRATSLTPYPGSVSPPSPADPSPTSLTGCFQVSEPHDRVTSLCWLTSGCLLTGRYSGRIDGYQLLLAPDSVQVRGRFCVLSESDYLAVNCMLAECDDVTVDDDVSAVSAGCHATDSVMAAAARGTTLVVAKGAVVMAIVCQFSDSHWSTAFVAAAAAAGAAASAAAASGAGAAAASDAAGPTGQRGGENGSAQQQQCDMGSCPTIATTTAFVRLTGGQVTGLCGSAVPVTGCSCGAVSDSSSWPLTTSPLISGTAAATPSGRLRHYLVSTLFNRLHVLCVSTRTTDASSAVAGPAGPALCSVTVCQPDYQLLTDTAHYGCHGVAASTHHAIVCTVERVSSYFDHLLLREPVRVTFAVTASPLCDLTSRLLSTTGALHLATDLLQSVRVCMLEERTVCFSDDDDGGSGGGDLVVDELAARRRQCLLFLSSVSLLVADGEDKQKLRTAVERLRVWLLRHQMQRVLRRSSQLLQTVCSPSSRRSDSGGDKQHDAALERLHQLALTVCSVADCGTAAAEIPRRIVSALPVCALCANSVLEWSSVHVRCAAGHRLPVCCLSLLPCVSVPYRRCHGCGAFATDTSALYSGLNLGDRCTYCDANLVSSF